MSTRTAWDHVAELNAGPRPRCATHGDTELVATTGGWVCPPGCGDVEAGRRYRLTVRSGVLVSSVHDSERMC